MKKNIKKFLVVFVSLMVAMTGLFASNAMALEYEYETIWDSIYDIDLSSWMTDLPDDIYINKINIPGTHDSGTAHVYGGVSGYASCQDWQIDEQLKKGIRCFDIRLDIPGIDFEDSDVSDLYLYHGVFPCTKSIWWLPRLNLEDVFEYCNNFLNSHPGETIILKLQNENGSSVVKNVLSNMYYEYNYQYDGHYRYYHYGDPIPMLWEVRGCIVLIDNDTNPGTYTKYEDHFEAKTEDKVTLVQRALDTSDEIANVRDGDYFYKDSYVNEIGKLGEPTVKCIFTSANRLGVDYLKADTIHTVSNLVNRMLWGYDFTPGVRYGWIFMDFPDVETICKIIYSNAIPVVETDEEEEEETIDEFPTMDAPIEMPTEEETTEVFPTEEYPTEEFPTEEPYEEESSEEESYAEEPSGEEPSGEEPSEEEPSGEEPSEESPSEESSLEDLTPEDDTPEEIPSEDIPHIDEPAEETPVIEEP